MLLLLISSALAQDALRLELSGRIPVTSTEAMGMGSAGIGFANGANGVFFHPAAPVNRRAGSTAPVIGSGTASLSSFVQLTGLEGGVYERWRGASFRMGGTVAVYNWGLGGVFSGTTTAVDAGRVTLTEGHLVAAHMMRWGAIGGGLRSAEALLNTDDGNRYYLGVGWEIGLLVTELPHVNLGATFRNRITGRALNDGPGPDEAFAPWELSVGLSWYGQVPRIDRTGRVVFDVVFEGPAAGLAPEGVVLSDLADLSKGTTFSPRLGGELEAIPNRLRLRAGVWVEPGTLSTVRTNLHGSAGFEVRLFPLHYRRWEWMLSLSFAADRGRGLTDVNWITLGIWNTGDVGHRHTWSGFPQQDPLR